MQQLKIAIVGAGIFGITAALRLSQEGFSIDLFETYSDIMQAASGINQYRLHRGYHYPRGPNTVKECQEANHLFTTLFAEAIIPNAEQYYCIAKEKSRVTGEQFLTFCKNHNLEFVIDTPEVIRQDSIDLCVRVNETRWDPQKLYTLCWTKLKASSIKLHLNTEATKDILKKYDFSIIATYSRINDLIDEPFHSNYQFELCEKLVIQLPVKYHNKGIVVLDGPFCCIDPLGNSNMHVMGHVVHAIHQRNVGTTPLPCPKFISYLNKGVVRNPKITHLPQFITHGSEFFKELDKMEHIGSMYTYRVVLPHVDNTDERPTIIRKTEKNIFTIFAGKIPTSVFTAEQITAKVKEEIQ